MDYRSNDDVLRLVQRFHDRTIPKDEWDHIAHLTVGVYYCMKYSLPVAINAMREGISKLNIAHWIANTGEGGYHETLTCFWLSTIDEFIRCRPRRDLVDTVNSVIRWYSHPDLPLEYYSRVRLYSPEARRRYIDPDLTYFRQVARAA